MIKNGLEIKFLKLRLEMKLQFKIIEQICVGFIVELLFLRYHANTNNEVILIA